MAHEIFISYSSADKPVADAVCHALEASGLRCWIAPRDAAPGRRYQGSIIRAIRECRAMVLLFSSASNDSDHVFRELHAASEHSKPVVPFRIEDVAPSEEFVYYLGPLHWLDALTEPVEQHIERLRDALSQFAREGADEGISGVATPPPHDPTAAPDVPGPADAPDAPDTHDRPHVHDPRAIHDPRVVDGHSRPQSTWGASLVWGLACGLLAATAAYALQFWSQPWLLAVWQEPQVHVWVQHILRFTAMFGGLAAAVRLKGPGVRAGLVGAVGGWAAGLLLSWAYGIAL